MNAIKKIFTFFMLTLFFTFTQQECNSTNKDSQLYSRLYADLRSNYIAQVKILNKAIEQKQSIEETKQSIEKTKQSIKETEQSIKETEQSIKGKKQELITIQQGTLTEQQGTLTAQQRMLTIEQETSQISICICLTQLARSGKMCEFFFNELLSKMSTQNNIYRCSSDSE